MRRSKRDTASLEQTLKMTLSSDQLSLLEDILTALQSSLNRRKRSVSASAPMSVSKSADKQALRKMMMTPFLQARAAANLLQDGDEDDFSHKMRASISLQATADHLQAGDQQLQATELSASPENQNI